MNNRQGIRPALLAVAAASILSTPPIGVASPHVLVDNSLPYVEPKHWAHNNAKEFGMSMKRQRGKRK